MVAGGPTQVGNGDSQAASAGDEYRSMLDQAERCRRLAREHYDRELTNRLEALANDFERSAADLARRRS